MQKYDPQYAPPPMGLIDLVVTIGCSLESNPKVDNVALVALVVFVLALISPNTKQAIHT